MDMTIINALSLMQVFKRERDEENSQEQDE